MCTILFVFQKHPKYPLILAANRDEFYERPTAKADYWKDAPDVFAGKDLVHGGTWLGTNKSGKFAAVTNYRDPNAPKGKLSRGALVSDFLKRDVSIKDYLEEIQKKHKHYSGFNLIVGEINDKNQAIGYYSNREDEIKVLKPGIYGLSNHLLDTPWQKVVRGKAGLEKVLNGEKIEKHALFKILTDRTPAEDKDLPDTGIGYEKEKILSPIFIETPIYGTRSSTIVLIDKNGEITFKEKIFH
jgi:uncharacterized protein with NRDE domain